MKFIIFPYKNGRWDWRLERKDRNGEIVARSDKSFATKEAAVAGVQQVQLGIASSEVAFETVDDLN